MRQCDVELKVITYLVTCLNVKLVWDKAVSSVYTCFRFMLMKKLMNCLWKEVDEHSYILTS